LLLHGQSGLPLHNSAAGQQRLTQQSTGFRSFAEAEASARIGVAPIRFGSFAEMEARRRMGIGMADGRGLYQSQIPSLGTTYVQASSNGAGQWHQQLPLRRTSSQLRSLSGDTPRYLVPPINRPQQRTADRSTAVDIQNEPTIATDAFASAEDALQGYQDRLRLTQLGLSAPRIPPSAMLTPRHGPNSTLAQWHARRSAPLAAHASSEALQRYRAHMRPQGNNTLISGSPPPSVGSSAPHTPPPQWRFAPPRSSDEEQPEQPDQTRLNE